MFTEVGDQEGVEFCFLCRVVVYRECDGLGMTCMGSDMYFKGVTCI